MDDSESAIMTAAILGTTTEVSATRKSYREQGALDRANMWTMRWRNAVLSGSDLAQEPSPAASSSSQLQVLVSPKRRDQRQKYR